LLNYVKQEQHYATQHQAAYKCEKKTEINFSHVTSLKQKKVDPKARQTIPGSLSLCKMLAAKCSFPYIIILIYQ